MMEGTRLIEKNKAIIEKNICNNTGNIVPSFKIR